ncbi:MAG: hypothetical protein BroJett025_09950 [Patescibacteria group bacterium]|nr:MAG: hypothetical protein BroJett025_09950 [Patescibacteria group bacterium]
MNKNEQALPAALNKLELVSGGGSGREATVRKALLGERRFAVKEYNPDGRDKLERLGREILVDIQEFHSLGSEAIPVTSLFIANHPETGKPTLYALQDWAEGGELKRRGYKDILNSRELRESLGDLLLSVCEYYALFGKMPDLIGASGIRIGSIRIPSINNLFPFSSENVAVTSNNKAAFIDPHVNRKFSGFPYQLRAELQNISFKLFAHFLLKDKKKKEVIQTTQNEQEVINLLKTFPVNDIGPSNFELKESEPFGSGRNILVVTESFGGIHGVAFSVKNYLRYLKINGFNPVLLTTGKEDKVYKDEEFGEIVVIGGRRTPGGDREVTIGTRVISNLISSRNFSAAFVFNPAILGLQVLPNLKLKGIPIVSTDETRIGKYLRYEFPGKIGILAQKMFERYGLKVKKGISRFVEAIVTPSESYKDRLEKRGVKKVVSIGKTANMSRENLKCERSNELRELIAPNGEKIIIYVGKVSRVKNLDFLARVCNLLNKKEVTYKLLIVGSNENEKELNRIKSLFDRSKTIFVGNQHGLRLANLYKVADLFVSPSSSETLGLTTIEAQLFGLPAIVSDHIGSVDTIRNNETGLNLGVEQQGDSKIWADTIARLLSDENVRLTMGEEAKKQKYTDWKSHCRQLLSLAKM